HRLRFDQHQWALCGTVQLPLNVLTRIPLDCECRAVHLRDASKRQWILDSARAAGLPECAVGEQLGQARGNRLLSRLRARRLNARIEWTQVGAKTLERECRRNIERIEHR